MRGHQILAALLAIGLGLGIGAAANAATSLNVVASGTFQPGSDITLTTSATSNGGETDVTVFGAFNIPVGVTGNAGLNSQVNLSTIGDMNPGWSSNALICTTAFCVAFNQTKTLPAGTAGITNVPIASTVFTIGAGVTPGTVITFAWRTSPSTQALDWFGLTQSPSTSVTVVPVPEPTTAALLCLGLGGLVLAGRRRA